jgi:anti-anti-sigma regulatory factor
MLRITIIDGRARKTILVEGKLAASAVAELESAWKQARQEYPSRRIVVDLSNATLIDSVGRAALVAMVDEGARLAANGIYTRYLIEQVRRETRNAGASRRRRNEGSGMDRSRL